MRKIYVCLLVAVLLSANQLFAQTDADRIKSLEEKVDMLTKQLGLDKTEVVTDSAAPKLTFSEKYDEKIEKIKSKIPFEISGSVDVYAQANFLGKQSNAVLNRAFYPKANSFELGMINIIMKKKIKKVGFVADLGFGPRAEAANNTIYANSIIAIKQLYMTYAPADWVEFTVGNFSTFFGYELIEPQNNFNYSTSLAFQNGPFYHTGLKVNFVKGKFNFLAGFFNDTDTKSDNDRNKYVGAQAGYTGDNGGVYLNFIGGNEPASYMIDDSTEASVYKNYKNSYDLTGSIKLGKSKKGKLGVNVAYHQYRYKTLKDDKVTRNKYALAYVYGQCDINQYISIGGRVGYLYNPDFVTPYIAGPSKHFTDFTLTAQINIVGGLRVVPEYRIDYAVDKVFLNRKGGGSNIQNTLGVAVMYTF